MSANDSRLGILIDSVFDDKGVNEARRDIDHLDDSVEQGGKSFSDYGMAIAKVGAGLAAAGVIAKEAYDAINEGAQLNLVESKFDSLTAKIGTTSDSLINDLVAATKGTRSEMELMAGAVDLMGLGLVKSHDEAVRMTRVVGSLNMDMNALTLTLTNKTTARFDTLGVAVDGFDERLDNLIATGMDVDDAFTEAFLQQAEEQIDTVGDAANSTTGDLAYMRAEWENFTNSVKQGAAAAFAPGLREIREGMNEAAAEEENLIDALHKGIITKEEYNKAQRAQFLGMHLTYGEVLDKAIDGLDLLARGTETAAYADELLTRGFDDVTTAVEANRGSLMDNYAELGAWQERAAEANPEWALMKANAESTTVAIGGMTSQITGLTDAAGELLTPIEELNDAIAAQNAAAAQTENAANYAATITAMGSDADIAAMRVENLTMKLLGIPPSVKTTVDVDTSAAEAKISRLTQQLGSLGAARAMAGEGDIEGVGSAAAAAARESRMNEASYPIP